MIKKYDVIVVGAGAAGMMSAVSAAEKGLKVLICEKNVKPGRKMLITGKGRCNVTNNCSVQTCIDSVTSNSKFLYSAFNRFTPQDTMDFFENRGLKLKTERGNRVFPVSDKALDVVNILISSVKKSGTEIIKAQIKSLIISENNVFGVVDNDGNKYYSDNVIIACGGKSYPKTGSTGDGYRLAMQAGHTVTPIRPSLVPLICSDSFCVELQGLALKNVGLKVISKLSNKIVYEDFGEMLFTHFGMSGPVILSASAHMDKPEKGNYQLVIDLKPALSFEKADVRILRDLNKFCNKDIGNSLFEFLPKSIIPVVLSKAQIPENTKCNALTKQQRMSLLENIKQFTVNVIGFRPIDEAIITKGGVNIKEINPKTMESRICQGLFFAGEVIDADAYTGGFNLQIAFSTGVLAGSSVQCRDISREG